MSVNLKNEETIKNKELSNNSTNISHNWKSDLSILGITIVWGSSFILMKNLLDYTPIFAYLSLRFILATIILCILFNRRLKDINKQVLKWGILVGLMVFGGMMFQVVGLQYTSASNSAFITGLCVVIVPLLSSIYLKKKPSNYAFVGAFLAAIGLFFLTGAFEFKFNKGDFLTFLCAICFAFQVILIDKAASKHDPVLIAVLQIATAAVFFTVIWGFQKFSLPVVNTTLITTILWTGALGTALAYGVQTVAQKYTSPTRTALIIACEPVFAVIFAWVIPNSAGVTEKPTLYTIIGCVMIFTGMLLSEIPSMKLSKRQSKSYKSTGA
ncbi:MAG TPA: DMT family transporter [Thermoclostridium sp.]|nr:DMT family transporter [Thermoclostridium sp.]